MDDKTLAVDANILIRSVLGTRVRELLSSYAETVSFAVPDSAVAEAARHLLAIAAKRRLDQEASLDFLATTVRQCRVISFESYAPYEAIARKRLTRRDPDDWPILATALALQCPIWTEDADFFGCGVATWTTNTVEQFLTEE